MKQKIFGTLLYLLPKNFLSYCVGVLVQIPLPGPVGALSVKWFASYYNINLEEAEHPISHYKTIGELFTRKLKAGVRPIGEGVVHPVDGEMTIAGQIYSNDLIQAKGKTYSINEFLDNPEAAGKFVAGHYFTYYLCPTDYHRVHSPVDGEVTSIVHVPGTLWPVNEWSVETIDKLFAVNERLIYWIDTPKGEVAYVMVGATNVGKMTVAFDQEVVTNEKYRPEGPVIKWYEPHVKIEKGQELGTFNMGSTVIVFYPKGFFDGEPDLSKKYVKLGESLN